MEGRGRGVSDARDRDDRRDGGEGGSQGVEAFDGTWSIVGMSCRNERSDRIQMTRVEMRIKKWSDCCWWYWW